MEQSRMQEFERVFSLEKPNSALVYDSLIYLLHEERKGSWSITTIKNYLSIAYLVAYDKSGILTLNRKLQMQEDSFLLFNTGLETNHQPLYCIGKAPNDDSKAIFLGFYTKTQIVEEYQLKDGDFEKLRSPKEFLAQELIDFSKKEIELPKDNYCKSELRKRLDWIKNNCKINDGKVENYTGKSYPEPFCDWMHIILDNCDRLPKALLYEIVNKGKYNNKYQIQYDILCNSLPSKGNKAYDVIKEIIERSINYSIQLSKVDYDMIVPYYYAQKSEINYAMPLYLEHKEKPDCALVFDQKGKVHTLLTIEQLSLNIKVIAPNRFYKWL